MVENVYTIKQTCDIISWYIFIKTNQKITVNPGNTVKEKELFEKAATIALYAYEIQY